MPKTITWLHLSDLHACRPRSGWDAKHVLDALGADLRRMSRDHGLRPDLIFFTGDAAFGHLSNERGEAISDQFREADDFLNAVREAFTPVVPKRNLFLVPGNHDVNRTIITCMDITWLESVAELSAIEQIIQAADKDWRQLLSRLHDYEHFLETYGYDHLLTGRDRLLFADMREVAGQRIGIAGFNSAWSSCGAGPDEYGRLWMGKRFQLETNLANLPPHDFSIALIHHPHDWLMPQEKSNNGCEIENHFTFVLHGHEHRNWVRSEASNGHTVLSAGACHEWSQGKNNGYNFVRLDLDEMRGDVWLREYESAGGGWRPCVINGRTDDTSGRWSLEHLHKWMRKARVNEPAEAPAILAIVDLPTLSGGPVADYESRYRKAVKDRLDYMHLFGIDVPRETSEYSLSVAYVTLELADEIGRLRRDDAAMGDSLPAQEKTVRRSSTDCQIAAKGEPATVEIHRDKSNRAVDFSETTLTAERFFNQLTPLQKINSPGTKNRLLIRGIAGCGKSTLLRWAAVEAARHGGNSKDWRSLVPFIIRLRDFPDGELPRPKQYPLLLAKELPDAPSGWVDDVLKNGRALLMFDGADEVPPAVRDQTLAEIRQLIHTFPHNAFVVTTRPEAIEHAEFREQGFLSARVEAMSPVSRNTFIDRWHDAMEVRLRNRDEPRDLRPVAARLKELLEDSPAISRLTGNPLLCASICALHWSRSENLPETPVDLCEKLTEMLLLRRDKERPGKSRERTEDEQYIQLDYAKRKGLVSRLAYRMLLAGLSGLTEGEVDRLIAEGLTSFQLTDLSPKRIRRALIERSGMLQEASDQRIEFIHNTLKEYLAAERLVNSGDYQIIADHCHEESWQSVTLFALSLPREGSDFATQLLRAIQSRIPFNISPNDSENLANTTRLRQFFFFRCCTTAYMINDAKVLAEFNSISDHLFPPRDADAAKALASCGDAVVPYLALQEKYSEKQRAACVRALSIIGGPRAIRMLHEYSQDQSAGVIQEFMKLLVDSPKLFMSVRPVNISTLQSLELSNINITDLSGLASLTALNAIGLFNTGVVDISPLSKLINLETLDLQSTMVTDVSPLSQLARLRSLDLRSTPVTDISPLASLTELCWLSLQWTPLKRVSALANLTNLEMLGLQNTQVSNVAELASLIQLKTLYLHDTQVNDISALAKMTNLEKLDLENTQVADVSPLKGLSNLRQLFLQNTLVTDISSFASLNKLEELYLNGTQVSDVSVLVNLPNLRLLYLGHTRVNDISAIKPLIERGVKVVGVSRK